MAKYAKASEIRVGVVGYGGAFNMGKVHLTEMQKAGMTPVAVAEIDRERLKVATREFPGIGTFKVCLTISNEDTSNYCSDSICKIIDLNPQVTYLLGGLLYAGNFPINNPYSTNDVGYAYL